MFNYTCSLHTCVCAGSRRRRVRLSGFRRQGIASLLGVSQVTLFRSGSVPNNCNPFTVRLPSNIRSFRQRKIPSQSQKKIILDSSFYEDTKVMVSTSVERKSFSFSLQTYKMNSLVSNEYVCDVLLRFEHKAT